MFQYGKRAGYLTIIMFILAVLPMAVAIFFIPQMPDQVAMRFDAAGEVTRWGSRFELLLVPTFCLVLTLATYMSGRRQASGVEKDSNAAARLIYERFLRNGLVTSIVLNAVGIYLVYAAFTGAGLPF